MVKLYIKNGEGTIEEQPLVLEYKPSYCLLIGFLNLIVLIILELDLLETFSLAFPMNLPLYISNAINLGIIINSSQRYSKSTHESHLLTDENLFYILDIDLGYLY